MNQPVFYQPGKTHLEDTINPETMLSHIGKKSLQNYLAESPDMVCIEFNEALKQIEKAEYDAYISPKAQIISKERWYEMLECLPPCRWGGRGGIESFHISERMTGDVVSWYTKDASGNFVTFMDLSTISPEKIIERHQEALNTIC